MKKKMIKRFVAALLLGIFVFWFYYYVVERCMALYAYHLYSTKQGVDSSVKVEKQVFKDWKNGGYAITVSYSDNTEYEYQYSYKLQMNEQHPQYYISLWIIDLQARRVLSSPYEENVKYKPLD